MDTGELTDELLKKIVIEKELLLSKVGEIVKGSLENISITLTLLVWIEKYYQEKRSAWSMIHKKGQQWLAAQGVKYAEVAPLVAFIE